MTELKCSAVTCVYNKDRLCSKGNIDVTGENAKYSDETSCGSFLARSEGSVENRCSSGCGCEEIRIDCKAHRCTYNDHSRCTASAIHVDGGHAGESRETNCATFRQKV